MKRTTVSTTVLIMLLSILVSASFAQSFAKSSDKKTATTQSVKQQRAKELVDLNSATKDELRALPVANMTFEDARKILSGGDMAATEYFKRQTSAQLTTAFKPIVHNSLVNVGVVKQYNAITQNSVAGSLAGQNFNLDNYVVGKTLDGLFYMLGQEEKKIRKDPAAQTTSLLKEVFGKRV